MGESIPSCVKKVPYETELKAPIALFRITTKEHVRGRNEQRAYACGNHWHLTSMPRMKVSP